MFKNRWGALFFVCLTALGAVGLIGGEDDEGLVLSAAGELTDVGNDFGNRKQELSEPEQRAVRDAGDVGQFSPDEEFVEEYAPDDDLIDDTRGFEPAPDIDPSREVEKVEEEGDVVMYIDDA
jgi:hypothetical protein